jgi:hypothetical protein
MHLILRYPSGRLVDGILLAAGPDRLRVVVRRLNETMELVLTEGQWTTDRGDRVEVEGWLSDGSSGIERLSTRVFQRVSTATH